MEVKGKQNIKNKRLKTHTKKFKKWINF